MPIYCNFQKMELRKNFQSFCSDFHCKKSCNLLKVSPKVQFFKMAFSENICIPWIIQGKTNDKRIKTWHDYYTMDYLWSYNLTNLGESGYNYSRSSHHHGYLKTVPNYPPLPFLLKRYESYDFIMHFRPYFQSNC